MSSEDVEIVREAIEKGINLDPRSEETWERAAAWLHPEFEYREDPALPGAGSYKGLEAFREAVTDYYEPLEEMRLEAEEFFDCGDRVVVTIHWWARSRAGMEADMLQAGIFTVRDGKVASWQVCFDHEAALRNAGVRG
jgi:ketosteroid isomerase-like protein